MVINNEKLFQTEDIDEVQEIYENLSEKFSKHKYAYNEKINTYDNFLKELWGDDWQEMFSIIYGDNLDQFKEDYEFDLKEFYEK